MTTPGSLRRLVLTTTLGSFSIAALMGVLALLGGDFGEGQARVLMTTVLVGLASIAVLTYLTTAGTPYQPVGVAGGIAVLVPLLTGLLLIWADYSGNGSDATWKAFGLGIVVASSLAQVSLLLVLGGAHRSLRPLLLGTLSLVAVLGVLVSWTILAGEDGEGLLRLIGVIAILDVLGTVVVIALAVVARTGRSGMLPGSGPGAGSDTGAVAVTLPGSLVVGLDARARATGSTRDDLVAQAVTQYLGSHADPVGQSGT